VTSPETAAVVLQSGSILSAVLARQLPGRVLAAEPRNAAGDPPDYFEYVMFGAGNCPGPDKLVYERAVGHVPPWAEFEKNFRPAIRFFFRVSDLIAHPGYCSDGLHTVKIRDELALEPLLAAVLIPEGLPGSVGLTELAEAAVSASKTISCSFAGCGPRQWAQKAYRTATAQAATHRRYGAAETQ
jgi:hypothetical protein